MKIRDRIREFRRTRASAIRPHPQNWRTHGKHQLAALRGVLEQVGFAGAILTYEDPEWGLTCIDGHAREELMGESEVPVLITDLSREEARTVLATFDPIGALAGADDERLASILRDVQASSDAVRKMLDDLSADAGIEQPKPEAPEARIDEAEELQRKWGVERGQLWVMGKCYVCDCGEVHELP